MSEANKTRFEVQKVLRDNIIAGLTALGVDPTKFTIMEAGQTVPTSKNDVILFKLESSDQLGWQAAKFTVTGAVGSRDLKRRDEFIDHQRWTISVLKRRMPTATVTTLQSEDVARLLMAWFNGKGCAYFRQYGMANTNITESPVTLFKSSSDVYERSSSFRLNLQVPKAIESDQAEVGELKYAGNLPV